MSAAQFTPTYKRLAREAATYLKLQNIVNKLNTDASSTLERFYKHLSEIFQNEVKFTYGCRLEIMRPSLSPRTIGGL